MTRDRSDLGEILRTVPVIPVLSIAAVEAAVPLAEALVAGGITVLEVTFRTPAGPEALARIVKAVPQAIVGAGTVCRHEQYDAAERAGARFIVSPGATPGLVARARDSAVPWLPAAATTSEIMVLLDAGFEYLKFFPAEAMGGPPVVEAFAGPLPEAKFCPTGGIDAGTAPEYLALPNVVCVGGSWLAPGNTVAAGNWPHITALAREAAGLGR